MNDHAEPKDELEAFIESKKDSELWTTTVVPWKRSIKNTTLIHPQPVNSAFE